ncbi:hypothetical protein BJ322DRAFT_1018623 [Thelephora terrestris]|uniref:Uncharacterized protein n=1 Tax=Thelephora terrestris TaxID=56493 RepID=A0A9P6HIA1_9AGAM|nr:hypothetical protein BJ322DRAFT_1018623 [Thelephora terrestris]
MDMWKYCKIRMVTEGTWKVGVNASKFYKARSIRQVRSLEQGMVEKAANFLSARATENGLSIPSSRDFSREQPPTAPTSSGTIWSEEGFGSLISRFRNEHGLGVVNTGHGKVMSSAWRILEEGSQFVKVRRRSTEEVPPARVIWPESYNDPSVPNGTGRFTLSSFPEWNAKVNQSMRMASRKVKSELKVTPRPRSSGNFFQTVVVKFVTKDNRSSSLLRFRSRTFMPGYAPSMKRSWSSCNLGAIVMGLMCMESAGALFVPKPRAGLGVVGNQTMETSQISEAWIDSWNGFLGSRISKHVANLDPRLAIVYVCHGLHLIEKHRLPTARIYATQMFAESARPRSVCRSGLSNDQKFKNQLTSVILRVGPGEMVPRMQNHEHGEG